MPSYAYFKKKIIPLEQANVNVMTNFMHYGTGVFEGIRGNWNKQRRQLYLFRLKEHYERMLNGCQILNIDLPYSLDELCDITVKVTAKSAFEEDIYVRPLAYKSSEALGVRLHNLEADFLVFVFPWGPYLDTDRARCVVSSWRFPKEVPRQKLTGLYVTNALAKTEAVSGGFDEAIMLNADGYVAEGSGENIFLMKNSKLFTPPGSDGPLIGITRNTVIQLAKNELGIDTIERHVDRIELYAAEEIFLTGTAAHITPVAEIDRRKIAGGEIGQVTKKLQKLYADIIVNKNAKYSSWCTPVYKK
ncbi:MAG TPA: branched-chain amino acid transaminase [Dehalococcoidales bacterium]